MIERAVATRIEHALSQWSCVSLGGPRQVGKSTLAKTIADRRGEGAVRLDLRRSGDRAALLDQDTFFLTNVDKLVVVDEVHLLADAIDIFSHQIDEESSRLGPRTKFLLLGSESHKVRALVGDGLGGRSIHIDVTPFQLEEVCVASSPSLLEALDPAGAPIAATEPIATNNRSISLEQLWLRGGIPKSLLANTDQDSLTWRRGYLSAYDEVDADDDGEAGLTRACLEKLGATPGRLTNMSAEPRVTRKRFGYLKRVGLVRELRPWARNTESRLVKSPKLYIRDSGLLHALRGREKMADLLGTEGLPGPSWEGFCIEAVAALIGDRAEVFFYRNEDGDEIDLVIEFSNSKTWVVEIKFNPDAKIRPGFWRACKAIGPAERFVVHKGDAAFTNRDGLQALPLLDFLSLVGTIV